MNNLSGILSYIKPYRFQAALNAVCNILYVFFSLFSMTMVIPMLGLIMGQVDKVTEEPVLEFKIKVLLDYVYYQLGRLDGTLEMLAVVCMITLVMFFLKNLTGYLALYFISPVRSGVVRDIRERLHNKILKLPLSFYTDARKGDIISRMSNDVNEIEWSILTSLEAIFRDPLSIIGYMVFLFSVNVELTLFVLILVPVAGILIGLLGKSLKRTAIKGQDKLGDVISIIEETLTGLRVIKGFNAEKETESKFGETNNSWRKLSTKVHRKQGLSNPLGEFIGAVMTVVIMWFGGKLVLVDEVIGGELFIGYIVIFSQVIRPAKALTSTYLNVKRGMAAAGRINEILAEEITIKDKPNAQSVSEFNEGLKLEKVSFAYDSTEVLKNISLEVPKGTTVALVGPSGAGKTTLADLIPRFHDPSSGKITVDGKDIGDLKIKDLRTLIGVVTQESLLFNDTVANNITLGQKDKNREQVINAAKVANAAEFIDKMESGYDTGIGEKGSKLSGGQRQRLSIARAVYKNPPILILDEATSSLDTESERLVQDALSNLMKDRTSIVIAHRLSTIQSADLIVVLENGEIVEKGTHIELLNSKGLYKKLYDLQTFE